MRSIAKYPISKKDDSRFNLINFHPSGYDPTGRFQLRPDRAGEPEAFMTLRAELTAPFVIKGSA